MPLILTDTTKLLAQQTNIKVNIIVEIDGFSNYKFGTLEIDQELNFDMADTTFDEGHLFDGSIVDPTSSPWISLDGTTKTIGSQLNIDKGIEAVRSFTVELLDKDDTLSTIFTPGNTVTDLLGQKAKVYLNLKGSEHPGDSLLIIEGVVGSYSFTNKGTCKVNIDHASQLKRQEIFLNHASGLSGALGSGDSTIAVSDTSGFQTPTTDLETYVRIGDEIIKYTGVTSTTLTGLSRAQFSTSTPSSHDSDTEVTSFYRLQGNAIHLALKILLSGSGYAVSTTSTAFGLLSATLTVDNSILLPVKDAEQEFGLVAGDHIEITGSDSNNVTTTVTSFGKIDDNNSYIVVAATLTNEDEQTATIKFKSQYDVLNDGAGMNIQQVDVAKHLYWYDLFSSNFATLDFYLEEPIEVDEFVNKELYRPSNLYSVPGNRASVKMTIPPLSDQYTKTLSEENVINPNSIAVNRSINKYHYNTIIYKYDPDRLDLSKYMTGKIVVNNDSLTRIGAGNKPLKIESQGLRRSDAVNSIIDINATRFLDRYRFAAESFKIQTFFSNISIECGDVVVVSGLNIYDSTSGNRDFSPRLFEVINKSVNIGSAKISLELLSTSFGLDAKFGVVSPSSEIGSGATTTTIPLNSSFEFSRKEKEKWEAHIGATILVHDKNWSTSETTIFNGFSETEENTMLVDALSGAPSAGHYVNLADYGVASTSAEDLLKDMYVFVDPKCNVASVASAKQFTVTAADAAKLFTGAIIEVHNSTYSNSSEGKIASITSGGGATETVVLENDLTYTPSSTDIIDLIGFNVDSGKPYRVI